MRLYIVFCRSGVQYHHLQFTTLQNGVQLLTFDGNFIQTWKEMLSVKHEQHQELSFSSKLLIFIKELFKKTYLCGGRVSWSSKTKGVSSDQAKCSCLAGHEPMVAVGQLYLCQSVPGFLYCYTGLTVPSQFSVCSVDGAVVSLFALYMELPHRYNKEHGKPNQKVKRLDNLVHIQCRVPSCITLHCILTVFNKLC